MRAALRRTTWRAGVTLFPSKCHFLPDPFYSGVVLAFNEILVARSINQPSSGKIVVIGASAGGIEAVTAVVQSLPEDFPAPIALVVHIPPDSPSMLARIVERRTALKAKQAQDGETLLDGTIYVAPPDRHLLIERDRTVRTVRGPRENRHRPAIDPLFRSAALAARADCIGVVLSGSLDDGTAGLIAIKRCGGVAVVQDPEEALYPSMPRSALEHVAVDYVLRAREIGDQLIRSMNEERPAVNAEGEGLIRMEKKIAEFTAETLQDDDRPGKPSAFSCPDCGGVLWEIGEGDLLRYRCRVGHALSPETMLGAQAEVLEEAMWTAMKTLEETARLSHRLSLNETERGHEWMAARFRERESDARRRAEVIRQFLITATSTVPDEDPRAERPVQ
jgi:two-component system chemotaxis response regulator CheB